MSEFGGGARQGLHGSAEAVWTEEYQERLYQHQVPMLKRIPFLVAGAFQSLLCLTVRERPPSRNARPIAYTGPAPTGH